MKIETYDEAIQYLESFIGKVTFKVDKETLKHKDPLERMRTLLSLLGNPQNKFPSVLIGGTSGKGSTAYLISHILTTSGYKTGLTISPHLQRINERIQINNQQISDEKFVKLLNFVIPAIEYMKGISVGLAKPDLAPQGAPSYFEILVGMAFKYFADQKVDIAVVEVGMGGEFDATNTLYPLVAILTNVSLDHTNVLGGTVQKIAKTKVGIIKGSPRPLNDSFATGNTRTKGAEVAHDPAKRDVGSPRQRFIARGEARPMSLSSSGQNLIVVTGVKQPSVIKIVEERCKKVGAKPYRLGKDFDFKIKKVSLNGTVFDTTILSDRLKKLSNLRISLLGRHQVENASLAIEAVLQLEQFGFRISEEHIRKALETAFFPGRFEILRLSLDKLGIAQDKTSSTLVLDGAHNPTKMRAFLSTLKKLYPKNPKVFIVAFKNDKDIKGMLKQILPVADHIIITEFRVKTDTSTNASSDALNLKSQISNLKYYKDVRIITLKNSKMALDKALSLLAIQQFSNSTIIVVTGSLYLVGEIRNSLALKKNG